MNINENFLKLKAGYLFPEISRRVNAWTEANPDKANQLIRCGIGDVTEPLPLAVREAMHAAIDEQGVADTFHGYGPEQGYAFLREAIVENQFADLNISTDEVFISDGSKCDTGNILDIFGQGNKIATQFTSIPTSWPATLVKPTKMALMIGLSIFPATPKTTSPLPFPRRKWI